MCYRIAHELKLDEDVVMSWPVAKVKGWITFFQLDNDLQKEAMDGHRAQAEIEREAQRNVPKSRPGVTVTHGADF